MIIDYLKRRGMTASVNSVLTEARVDPMSPETAETVQLMDLLNQMHGRNPQPATNAASEAGFLRDWWGAFWQMYQTKLTGPRRMQSSGMSSPVMQAQGQSHLPPPSQQQPPVNPELQRRAIILTAMQSVGLAGRDPSTLTPEEQRVVTMAIQQLQAQQLQRLQWPGRAEEALVAGGGSSSKRKKTDPGLLAATSAQPNAQTTASSAAAVSPRLTPQQMLHMRAAQIQQQQQQQRMMMMAAAAVGGAAAGSPVSVPPTSPYPMGATAFPAGTSRVIMPGPGGVPIPMTRSSSGPGNPRPKKGGATSGNSGIEMRPIRASPQPPEMDESALLSFFGTPQDWFAASPMTSSGSSVTDQFGNIPVVSASQSAAAAATADKVTFPTGAIPDALGLTTNIAGGSSVDSSPYVILESPRPEMLGPVSFSASSAHASGMDSNDLLLVNNVNDDETHPTEVKATESGLFLEALASLGQHTPGTKAVSASFSHDGLLMGSGGHDKRIILYHVPSRQQLAVLEGQHMQQITQVRFAPSGERRLLASSSFDKTIMVWDLGGEGEDPLPADGNPARLVNGEAPKLILRDVHEEPIWSIDFVGPASNLANECEGEGLPTSSPLNLRLCSIDAAGKMVIWDLETGVALHTTVVRPHDDRAVTVRQVRGRPRRAGEATILAVAHGSNVEFFDCDRYEFVSSLPIAGDKTGISSGSSGAARSIVAINWGDAPSAWHLITVTPDSVSIWDVAPPLMGGGPAVLLASHQVPADKITCCSLLAIEDHTDEDDDGPGRRVAVFGGYQSIYLWEWEGSLAHMSPHGSPNPEHRLRVVKFPAHEGLVVSLPVIRSGPLLIGSVSHDGWAKLWKIGRVQSESLENQGSRLDRDDLVMVTDAVATQHTNKAEDQITVPSLGTTN